jgi:hypothetical protein
VNLDLAKIQREQARLSKRNDAIEVQLVSLHAAVAEIAEMLKKMVDSQPVAPARRPS